MRQVKYQTLTYNTSILLYLVIFCRILHNLERPEFSAILYEINVASQLT